MAETLAPGRKDIEEDYRRGFAGMTAEVVPLDALLQVREDLIPSIVGQMPEIHRRFLVGFEQGDPDWKILDLSGPEMLPAVRWRQQNLVSLNANQRARLVSQLEQVLSERSTKTANG